ncbi:MAG TPA: acetate kinase, partial [Bacteroidetes bacterium]|nr:acetate kinase [Bacteroidota bacterium]
GDLDPFGLLYLMEQENLSVQQAGKILMSKGGILGISGTSGDFRDIEERMDKGDKRSELAFKTFVYNVKRYIGEYLAALNGADCIVFTAGAGEHSARLRKAILENMENLGIVLDEGKNDASPTEGVISHDESRIKLAVIPTNEEIVVASEVKRYLEQKRSTK